MFYLPDFVPKDGFKLRNVWALWNLVLAGFSLLGVVRTVPYLLWHLNEYGFNFTTCEDSQLWFLRHDETNPTGFWVTLFIYSKIPELVDTLFLVLQKKDVIFLHWFHHVTVLLYCWHAFANWTASGLWFVAMNFSVHSIMYFYYFLAISGFKVSPNKSADDTRAPMAELRGRCERKSKQARALLVHTVRVSTISPAFVAPACKVCRLLSACFVVFSPNNN